MYIVHYLNSLLLHLRPFRQIEECPTEICKRHRYHALRQKWVVDTVSVKIQTEVGVVLTGVA